MKIKSAQILENENEYIIDATYEDGSTDEIIRVLKRLDGANFYIHQFYDYLYLVSGLMR